MGAQGVVVLPGQGSVWNISPDRSLVLKLLGGATCAFVPRGIQRAWKDSGAEAGRVLFLYTPAAGGGLVEEQQRTHERAGTELLQRHG